MFRLVILIAVLVPWTRPQDLWAQIGSDLAVFDVSEAGTIYDPADGSVVRYVSGTDAAALFFEARSAIGVPLGQIRRAPDLSASPPVVVTPADTPDFFEADGITPRPGPYFHPVVCPIDTDTLGLYVVDALPSGMLSFFSSTDGGATWILEGIPVLPLPGGGSGIVAAVRVPNGLHVDGFEVRVFYQTGSGAIRMVRSSIVAPGISKYSALDSGSDIDILEASEAGDASGFSPTGEVVALESGGFGLFFVPQSDSYLGFAESSTGLSGWAVTRGANDPLLSTAANGLAPDPDRPEIKEITVVEAPAGWTIFFDGAVPGGSLLDRALGRLSVVELSAVEFVRGDGNGDGSIGIADAVYSLGYLFSSGPGTCSDALDTDDSGVVDLADPISLLDYLFSLGSPPALPFPDCGGDATADSIDCLGSACP